MKFNPDWFIIICDSQVNMTSETNNFDRLRSQGSLDLPVGREVDQDARRMLDQLLDEEEAALQLNSPYGREKVGPARAEAASFDRRDVRSMQTALDELDDYQDLKLVLESSGGSVSTAQKIAGGLEDSFENIEAYIPQHAESGATLISLAADEIYLDRMANLGPLDVQMPEQDGTRTSASDVESAHHRAREGLAKKHPMEASAYESGMLDELDPVEYESARSSNDMMVQEAASLLESKEEVDRQQARQGAERLVRGYPDHGYPITADQSELFPQELIMSADERPAETKAMRRWTDRYSFESSDQHAVTYWATDMEPPATE